ncbi:hypothetical protein ACT453_55905, partial [Bacillus sp. D-CC]
MKLKDLQLEKRERN